MGCASSSPMVQTTGSEMLKAATHVASDATKTAEDAVEGNNNNVIIITTITIITEPTHLQTCTHSVTWQCFCCVLGKNGLTSDKHLPSRKVVNIVSCIQFDKMMNDTHVNNKNNKSSGKNPMVVKIKMKAIVGHFSLA